MVQGDDGDIEPIDYEIKLVPVTDGSGMSPFEYILSYPSINHGGKLPIIVLPHGGPHSVFAADWKLSVVFLNSLGYAVCQGVRLYRIVLARYKARHPHLAAVAPYQQQQSKGII